MKTPVLSGHQHGHDTDADTKELTSVATQSIAQGQAPAFPSSPERTHGITIRDYFAAHFVTTMFLGYAPEELARRAYEIADAMLKERAK